MSGNDRFDNEYKEFPKKIKNHKLLPVKIRDAEFR